MTTNNAVDNVLSGATGTGSFVGSTSPAVTTPSITTGIYDANGNAIIDLTATTSSVNYITATNAASGNSPSISATGAGTNLSLLMTGKGNLGVTLAGRTDGSQSSAGNAGQIISSLITSGSPVSLSTGVASNITSISITAGNWLILGNVFINNTTNNMQTATSSINTVSATHPDASLTSILNGGGVISFGELSVLVPPRLISITSTTTYYLVASCVSAGGTDTGYGNIYAIRIS